MDFRFTEEQLLFAATVRDILVGECSPAAVRDAWENDTGTVPGLWAILADTGVIGLTAPADAGGLGLSDIDLVLIMEELGRAACPEVVLEHTAVGLPLLHLAPTEIRERWLGPATAGDVRVSVSLGAPYVLGAAQADVLLLTAADGVHAVPREDVALVAQASVDETRRLCSVEWSPGQDTLVTSDPAATAEAADRAAVAAAAQCVGVAQQLLDMTVAYVQERRQFGAPVGANQAVKHHLAEVGKAIEFARPMVYRAAWCLSAGDAHRTSAAAMAKKLASDAVDLACRHSLQCHGAIAYTVEYDLQLWLKRGWALAAAWGSAGDHRRRLAAALLDR